MVLYVVPLSYADIHNKAFALKPIFKGNMATDYGF